MKNKYLLLIPIVLLTAVAVADNFTLTWDPAPGISHYRIFSSVNVDGITNAPWTFLKSVTNVNFAVVSNITAPPIMSFAATAVGTNGLESARATVEIQFKPAPPQNLKVVAGP